jgi:hypothetical protein
MALFIIQISVELFGSFCKIWLEEGVDLSFRFDSLVVGEIIGRPEFSVMKLHKRILYMISFKSVTKQYISLLTFPMWEHKLSVVHIFKSFYFWTNESIR